MGSVNFWTKRMDSLSFGIKRMDSANSGIKRMDSVNFGIKGMGSASFEKIWLFIVFKCKFESSDYVLFLDVNLNIWEIQNGFWIISGLILGPIFCANFWTHFLGSIWGAIFWAHFGAHYLGPFWVSLLGVGYGYF